MTKKILILLSLVWTAITATADGVLLFPADGATDVNPDTHLTLIFPADVSLGEKGVISIYDCETGRLVDRLDLSLPAGPTEPQPKNPNATYTPTPYAYTSQKITNRNTQPGTPSGAAKPSADLGRYQLTIIGGFSDGFHFYPVTVHGNTATIFPHNNMLEYGHRYAVTVDKDVFPGSKGIKGKRTWTFSTKKSAPPATQRTLVVAADGSGDFSTLQGAMDFVPDSLCSEDERVTVKVMNGDYEELVYFRNKRFITIEGQSRDGVRIHYANNEVMNPHPADIKTNEWPGTFPSRRAAVAADNCSDMVFRNLTLQNDCHGQAEGFLINGERNFLENVHIIGSGDALQSNGSAYYHNCAIDGEGDTVLGRGPAYFNHCTLTSKGAFMWIRNTEHTHGNVFVDCTFRGLDDNAVIARLPDNKKRNYPHAEVVLLNCTLDHIPAEGWGPIDEMAKTATLLEFNSHDIEGNPVDTSRRHPVVRQLSPLKDAETLALYYDWRAVLNWNR